MPSLRLPRHRRATLVAGAAVLCASVAGRGPRRAAAAPRRGCRPGQSPCAGLGVQPVTLTPVLPTQFSPITAQIGADCMAWQTFISLNWAADPNNPGQPIPMRRLPASARRATPAPRSGKAISRRRRCSNPPTNNGLLWSAKRPA